MKKKLTGSVKLKQAAKSTTVEPVRETPVPLQQEFPVKRKPGRPRKVNVFDEHIGEGSATFEDAKKLNPNKDSKALVTFRRAIADAEKMFMAPAAGDGGGTGEDAPIISKESLQRRVARRLNVLDRFLTDDKLIELLSFSSLKEVGVYEGIMLDKSQVLSGQPNVIIGSEDRARIDSVMPKLMNELRRRGLITTVSERSIEFKHP